MPKDRPAASRHSAVGVLERVGWVPLACLIGAVIVGSVAGIAWNTSPYYGRADAVAAASPTAAPVPDAAGHYGASLAPTRIEIPRLKARAPIVRVATRSDGELQIPENPKVVGWWKPGAKPGARQGTSVLAGHINFNGVQGTFATIGKLRPGDVVDVFGKYNASAERVRFRVTAVRTYHKTALPYRQIFDQKIAGRLALVTCGGPFDASTGNYLDNIVVYGVPIGSYAA